jgi:hypothetical protein
MYLIVTGLVLLGAVCGATIRLLPFVLVLVGAAAIAAVSAAVDGGRSWLDVVIAVVALQVGYALGIVGRAMLQAWRQRRANLGRRDADQNMRLPTGQNRH